MASPKLSSLPTLTRYAHRRSKKVELAQAPGHKPKGGMNIELLRQIFAGVDENMDGVIDVGEFYLSLKSTSLEDSALALFNKVDR